MSAKTNKLKDENKKVILTKYKVFLYSLDSFATNRRNTYTIALTLLIVSDSTQIANQNSFDSDKKSLVTCVIMVHTCDEHKHRRVQETHPSSYQGEHLGPLHAT